MWGLARTVSVILEQNVQQSALNPYETFVQIRSETYGMFVFT